MSTLHEADPNYPRFSLRGRLVIDRSQTITISLAYALDRYVGLTNNPPRLIRLHATEREELIRALEKTGQLDPDKLTFHQIPVMLDIAVEPGTIVVCSDEQAVL